MNNIQKLLELNEKFIQLCRLGDRSGAEIIDREHNEIYETLSSTEKNKYWKERERQYERR